MLNQLCAVSAVFRLQASLACLGVSTNEGELASQGSRSPVTSLSSSEQWTASKNRHICITMGSGAHNPPRMQQQQLPRLKLSFFFFSCSSRSLQVTVLFPPHFSSSSVAIVELAQKLIWLTVFDSLKVQLGSAVFFSCWGKQKNWRTCCQWWCFTVLFLLLFSIFFVFFINNNNNFFFFLFLLLIPGTTYSSSI